MGEMLKNKKCLLRYFAINKGLKAGRWSSKLRNQFIEACDPKYDKV